MYRTALYYGKWPLDKTVKMFTNMDKLKCFLLLMLELHINIVKYYIRCTTQHNNIHKQPKSIIFLQHPFTKWIQPVYISKDVRS